MKKLTLFSILGLLIFVALAIFAAFEFGEKSPIIAQGVVSLDPSLRAEAKKFKTLFIVAYDEESQMPMPYGAIKIHLHDFEPEIVYEFLLTKDNLRIMNPNAPSPKTLTLKARLDLDGQGGRAQVGDLVGEENGIPIGQTNIRITINTKVE